jgi:hypothetical protein
MTSWTYEALDTGHVQDALGADPRGYIVYSPDGRVMVLVLNKERRAPVTLPPTDEEKIALFDTMFAYSGTYTVEDDRVIHHIDMSWNHSWEGTNQIRFITIEGNRLTYRSAPAANPLTGEECVHTVLFERVE